MKGTVAPGQSKTRQVTVDVGRTISFMGEELRLYSTPSMVRDIEATCQEFLLDHIDPGENSIGMRVEVDHLAGTPLGATIEVTVTVVEVDRRRITFTATVRDPVEEIGRGRHIRFINDKAKSQERLAEKVARLKAAAG
jgi:predicted thioesterase